MGEKRRSGGFWKSLLLATVVLNASASAFLPETRTFSAASCGKDIFGHASEACHSPSGSRGTNRGKSLLSSKASTEAVESNEVNQIERLRKLMAASFHGDFDNYNQVIEDRKNGLLPREGGGHEHIHGTVVPLKRPDQRLAAFYFEGDPTLVYRIRCYEFFDLETVPSESSTAHLQSTTSSLGMRLYTLHPDLESKIRAACMDSMSWPDIVTDFEQEHGVEESMTFLEACDVSWSEHCDKELHHYIDSSPDSHRSEDGLHAVMVHGEATIDSSMRPGSKIRVLDQLSLFDDVFYIHDRGMNPETGEFVYGNQREVPYRLERVTEIVDGVRTTANPSLAWTLGTEHCTPDKYKAKLEAIGGPSPRMPPPQARKKSEE